MPIISVGAKDGVMGYPTPPPPALSPAELETYVEPAVRKVQEVGCPKQYFLWPLKDMKVLTYGQIEFSFQIMMLIAYALVKLSIIYFLRRLFVVGKSGTFNLVTIAMAIVITLWLIAFLGLFIFHCGSVVKNGWGSLATISTTCKYSFTAELGMASSDLILDLSVLALPFPMVRIPNAYFRWILCAFFVTHTVQSPRFGNFTCQSPEKLQSLAYFSLD